MVGRVAWFSLKLRETWCILCMMYLPQWIHLPLVGLIDLVAHPHQKTPFVAIVAIEDPTIIDYQNEIIPIKPTQPINPPSKKLGPPASRPSGDRDFSGKAGAPGNLTAPRPFLWFARCAYTFLRRPFSRPRFLDSRHSLSSYTGVLLFHSFIFSFFYCMT